MGRGGLAPAGHLWCELVQTSLPSNLRPPAQSETEVRGSPARPAEWQRVARVCRAPHPHPVPRVSSPSISAALQSLCLGRGAHWPSLGRSRPFFVYQHLAVGGGPGSGAAGRPARLAPTLSQTEFACVKFSAELQAPPRWVLANEEPHTDILPTASRAGHSDALASTFAPITCH